jgi:hypothetical protein
VFVMFVINSDHVHLTVSLILPYLHRRQVGFRHYGKDEQVVEPGRYDG